MIVLLYNQLRLITLILQQQEANIGNVRKTTTIENTVQNGHYSDIVSFTLPPRPENENLVYHQLPYCTSHEEMIRKHDWHSLYIAEAPYQSKTVHLQCPHHDGYYQQKPFPTWVWRPEHCQLRGWDSAKFLQQTTNQTISIIGDSLNWEMYSSLLQLLKQRVHQTDQHKSRELNQNHVQTIEGGKYKWKFVYRNDKWLQNVSDSIQKDFPNILVLNRGAHYQDDTTLAQHLKNSLVPVLKAWFEECVALSNTCRLFWRTTSAGHPNCEDYDEPRLASEMEPVIGNLTYYEVTNRTDYHWYDFQRQNKLALQLLTDELGSVHVPFQVIPAYEITVGRPDGHRAHQGDCLHNCYPGKMDTYNQVLFHYLQE